MLTILGTNSSFNLFSPDSIEHGTFLSGTIFVRKRAKLHIVGNNLMSMSFYLVFPMGENDANS